jgi:hypothetical protein
MPTLSVRPKADIAVAIPDDHCQRYFKLAQRLSFPATISTARPKFLEVTNLMKAPSTLLSPAVALRVWTI